MRLLFLSLTVLFLGSLGAETTLPRSGQGQSNIQRNQQQLRSQLNQQNLQYQRYNRSQQWNSLQNQQYLRNPNLYPRTLQPYYQQYQFIEPYPAYPYPYPYASPYTYPYYTPYEPFSGPMRGPNSLEGKKSPEARARGGF